MLLASIAFFLTLAVFSGDMAVERLDGVASGVDVPAIASRPTIHSTRGTVKTIDANTMVISRPKGRGDITLKLNASTHRNGTIGAGAAVSVRYRDEDDVHVAIAVALKKP